MSGIFSCFTRQSPVDALQIFQHSIEKANKDGRVSSSNLNNLLKSVKNSPETLTLNQYRGIQEIVDLLDALLSKQDSRLNKEKNAKITEAYKQASQKLDRDAKIARADEAKQGYTDQIDQGLKIIEEKILPGLKIRVQNASDEVGSTIEKLPKKAQKEARKIISEGNFFAFGKDTAITCSLFPSSSEKVETRNVYRDQKFEPHDKLTWTSLQTLVEKEAAAKMDLGKAITFLNHPDNFTFNKPDNTGKLELTAHQESLLELAYGNKVLSN